MTRFILAWLLLASLVPCWGLTPAGTIVANQAAASWEGGTAVSNTASFAVAQIAGVGIIPAAGIYETKQGTTLNIRLTIANLGNGPDSFSLVATSLRGWALSYPSYVGVLTQNSSVLLWVGVKAPKGSAGQTDVILLTVRSLFDSSCAAAASFQVISRKRPH